MVHGRSLLQMLPHALQNMDLDCAISKADTEELGFEFLETLFILHYLLPFRGNLLLCTFSVDFLPSAVVFGFEVGRAKVLRAVYVPAQSAEHVHIVAPKRSEEHTSELQSRQYLVCRLLLEKK